MPAHLSQCLYVNLGSLQCSTLTWSSLNRWTSKSSSSDLNLLKELEMFDWKSFHVRLNFSVILLWSLFMDCQRVIKFLTIQIKGKVSFIFYNNIWSTTLSINVVNAVKCHLLRLTGLLASIQIVDCHPHKTNSQVTFELTFPCKWLWLYCTTLPVLKSLETHFEEAKYDDVKCDKI